MVGFDAFVHRTFQLDGLFLMVKRHTRFCAFD